MARPSVAFRADLLAAPRLPNGSAHCVPRTSLLWKVCPVALSAHVLFPKYGLSMSASRLRRTLRFLTFRATFFRVL